MEAKAISKEFAAESEVAGNIWKFLRAQEYPEQYLNSKKLDKRWEDCAEKLSIDIARIQRLFEAPRAKQCLPENITRAAESGITASPTI